MDLSSNYRQQGEIVSFFLIVFPTMSVHFDPLALGVRSIVAPTHVYDDFHRFDMRDQRASLSYHGDFAPAVILEELYHPSPSSHYHIDEIGKARSKGHNCAKLTSAASQN
jgi:hypothetical protein